MAITLRGVKGSPLTYNELDGNFTHLEDADATHAALTNNPHSVTKTQVGLGNVDNTSDVNKPVSTATTTAIGVAVAAHVDDTTAAHADSAITFTPSGTGAVASTVQAKLRESISVKDFGAVGDGVADDTVAIQAAIDSVKPNSNLERGVLNTAARVYFPKGNYLVSASIKTYTGVHLFGDGVGSRITAAAVFTGTGVVVANDAGKTPADRCYAHITDLTFAAPNASGLWGFDGLLANKGLCVLRMENCRFYTPKGINLPVSQSSYLRYIRFENYTEIGIILSGNWNFLEFIDKENSLGTNSEPFILVDNTYSLGSQNTTCATFRNVLLEGGNSANQYPIKLLNCNDVIFEQLWIEHSSYLDSVGILCDNAKNIRFIGHNPIFNTRKLKAINNSLVYVDRLGLTSDTYFLDDFIETDGTSHVTINEVVSNRGQTVQSLDKTGVDIGRVDLLAQLASAPSVVPHFKYHDSHNANLLKNPSFESGIFGWTLSGANPLEVSFAASRFGDGLMAVCTNDLLASISQTITVPAEWIGRVMTFSYEVEVIDGISTSSVFGCGINQFDINRVTPADGPCGVSLSFIPQSAGSLDIGVRCNVGIVSGLTEVNVDNLKLSLGYIGGPGECSHKQIELGSKSITNGTAAPTTGTWKQGDIVFNTGASSGGAIGWVCVTAGTAGTWATFGHSIIQGSATYDPASLNDGVGTTTTVTVTGAALGDFAEASFSNDLQGISLTAWVSAANTVSVRFQNESGGTLDLASGTLRARVRKA